MQKDNRRIVNGWAMYDWANSVYSLVISSSIFPIFYENSTPEYIRLFGRSFRNTALFSYTLSFSFLLVAIITPLLSGVADYSGRKKSFMKVFCYIGAVSCAGLYFFNADAILIGLAMTVLAAVGFSGSQVFYNAFLPEIASVAQQDRVSAKGYTMGYIGSVILLIFNLTMISNPGWFGLEGGDMPARISFLTVGLWWAGFAQIPFARLPDNVYGRKVGNKVLYKGYLELRKVWIQLRSTSRLKRFLISFFVYNMGVQTVMYMAVSFAKNEITGMPDSGLIMSILIIQIIAVAGAYLSSYSSGKAGNIPTLSGLVIIWIFVCIMAFYIYSPVQFYILAAMVGFVMGGIQSLSRSTYSKFLPETTEHASYFSFFDVADKVGIVIGTFIFGFVYEITGGLRNSALALAGFFIIGFILLLFVPKQETSTTALGDSA